MTQVQKLLNRYLLVKPSVRMAIEWPIIVTVGVLGEIFSWGRLPLSPYSNVVGGAIFLGGWALHVYCHNVHKQAHEQSQQIDRLVTTGPLSVIRHPLYLGLMLMYLGFAIAWGVVYMLLPAFFFSALTVLIAIKEEAFLLQKFGRQYQEYMQDVPWRFIPRIF